MVATSAYRGITLHLVDGMSGESTSVTILGARNVKDAWQAAQDLPLPPSMIEPDLVAWERAYQFFPPQPETIS